MTDLLARCPQCQRSFRILPSTLDAADGKVRCGNCRAVFHAPSHSLQETPPPATARDELDNLSFTPDGDGTAPFCPLPDSDDEAAPVLQSGEPPADQPAPPGPGETEASPEEDAPGPFDFQAEFVDEAGHQPSGHWGFPSLRTPPSGAGTADFLLSPGGEPSAASGLPPEVTDSPVELESPRRRRHGVLRSIALFSGALLLMTGLGAQYLWYNLDTLQQQPRMRTLMTRFCIPLGCTLPPRENLNALTTDQLLVRSHPRLDGALQVTFIFRNRAAFEQPFPDVELHFVDERSRPVASRTFRPGEYLPEGLRDFRMMPVDTPVQAQLAIVDPGPEAANYSLRFRRAGSQSD